MIDIDDQEAIRKIDTSNMINHLIGFTQQCRDAVDLGKGFEDPWGDKGLQKIVIAGMGGSAIGGDILRSYLGNRIDLPIYVNRDYTLPGFVDKYTLLFVVSYSGNTEETLSSFEQGRKMGARIVTITSGGIIEDVALREDIPIIRIPKGLPPRASLGYLFFPLLIVLERLGLIDEQDDAISETITLLRELGDSYRIEVDISANKAKDMAVNIYGKLPIIYGVHGYTDAAALRWKGQFNENSKTFASCNILPELDHNEVVGWKALSHLTKDFFVIFLRCKDDIDRLKMRIDITKSLISGDVSDVSEIWSEGNSRLARIFSLICLGDFTSYYLAILNNIDPTPVKVIDRLKKELAQ